MRNNPKNASQAEKKFMALFEKAPVGYLILNNDGTIRELNLTALKLFGRERAELIENHLSKFANGEDRNKLEDFLQTIFQNNSDAFCELSLSANGNGSVFVHLAGGISRDFNGALVTMTNLTLRRQQEVALQRALEDSEQSERMKIAFLSDLSHEIRTPLHGILSLLQLIHKENHSDPKQEKIFRMVKKNADQLLTIITSITDLSKIESKQLKTIFTRFNLNNLMDEIISIFQNDINSYNRDKITLSHENGLPDDKSDVFCDQKRLIQVLNNLIGNALKFTTEGSVNVSYSYQNEELVFCIRDTGKGIPEGRFKVIFNRFYTPCEQDGFEFSGIGFGLPVSKGIIELLGGRMWLTSQIGKGSDFYFTLPGNILVSDSWRKEPARNPELTKYLEGRTILIAEDLKENFEFIEAILHGSGLHILHAGNGKEAIELCLQHPEIDLVLMDVRMPVVNGLTATAEIRKTRPGLTVVAVTACSSPDHQTKCHDSGCSHVITKPFTRQQLISVIQKYLVT